MIGSEDSVVLSPAIAPPQVAGPLSEPLRPRYRADIEGLRAVAVLAVIGFHAGVPWLRGGFVGVDVFFVISGFLITRLLCAPIENRTFSFADFYRRRAKRILPALFFLISILLCVGAFLFSPKEFAAFGNAVIATVSSGSNIFFWYTSDYFASNSDYSPLLMTWSLGIEEQFYLLFPVFFFCCMMRGKDFARKLLLVLAVLSFLIAAFLVISHPTAAFYLLPARAWELTVGCLLALYESEWIVWLSKRTHASNWLAVVGFVLIALAVCLFDRNTTFPGPHAALPVLGAALLIATPRSFLNVSVFSVKWMAAIGLISYSWYLWHWPLLSIARLVIDSTLRPGPTAVILCISLVMAIVSYHVVEQPFRHSTASKTTSILYAVAALITACALYVLITNGLAFRYPRLATLEAGTEALRVDRCLAIYGDRPPNFSDACVATEGKPAIALVGDSHAASLAPALRDMAAKRGLGIDQLTKVSCPALMGATRNVSDHPGHDRECFEFRQATWAYVRTHPEIKTVVLASFWSAPLLHEDEGERYLLSDQIGTHPDHVESLRAFGSALETSVSTLQSWGKDVVIVEDNPTFVFDPVRHVKTRSIKPRLIMATLLSGGFDPSQHGVSRNASISAADALVSSVIAKVAAADPGLIIYDPKQTLCDARECLFEDGSAFLYSDPNHLSEAGAQVALRDFPFSRLQLK